VLVTHCGYDFRLENHFYCGFAHLDYDCRLRRLETHYDCEMHHGCRLLVGKHSGYFQTPMDFDL